MLRAYRWALGLLPVVPGVLLIAGCYNTPVDVSDFGRGPAPLRMPGPGPAPEECSYEESLQGHHIFEMYCGACHNARTLAERPFASYQNAAQHMRVRANLTGEEYAKLTAWLRRWHDVPPPEQNEAPSPKRFFFAQPINELRQQQPKTAADLVAGPRAGMNSDLSPGQPLPGNSPREAR